MGIQINGQTDTITSTDGSYTLSGSIDIPTTTALNAAGVNVTGVVTASSFVGDGSTLTGIDATALKDTDGNVIVQAEASGINVTGVSTFQGNVDLGDNDRLRLGDDSDLQIWHQGSYSIIQETGPGQMFFQSDGTGFLFRKTDGENIASLNVDGSVDLYYNNSKKFETTAGGVDITGHAELDNVNISGLLTATSAEFSGNVTVLGDLTYENVTNLDSVGVATARSGLRITGGGLDVVGVSTFSSDLVVSDKIIRAFDTDTAIRFPAGDTFTVETAGIERVRVANNGRIGVGTISPLLPVHVEVPGSGTSDAAAVLVKNDSTSYGRAEIQLRSHNNYGRVTLVGGAEGTNAGNGTFDLKVWDNSGASNTYIRVDGESYSNYLSFWTGSSVVATNTEKMRITKDGNVGIGSTVPTSKLDINPGGNSFFKFGQDADNPKLEIFRSTGTLPNSHYGIEIQQILEDLTISTAGPAALGSHSFTERLRITSNGKLIVTKLQSESVGGGENAIQSGGNISVLRRTNDAFGPYVNLGKSRNTSEGSFTIVQDGDIVGSIGFCGDDGTDINSPLAYINGVVDGTPGVNSIPGALSFRTTASGTVTTERLRIASTGAFGLSGANYGSSGQVLTSQGSGSAPQWATPSAAGVIQVKSTTKTDTTSYTSSSGSFSSDVMTVSITPTSSSNKILIIAHIHLSGPVTSRVGAKITVGGSEITAAIGNAAGSSKRSTITDTVGFSGNCIFPSSMTFLHSPGTTSTLTYGVQISIEGSQTVYLNQPQSGSTDSTIYRPISTITVMEVLP